MRKLSFLTLTIAASIAAFTQVAPVPTSWDCSGTEPEGWVQVQTGTPGNLFYVTADLYTSAPSSCRLDNTGEYILIQIDDEPGLVSYNIKGSTGGGTWAGTFKTQWSIDGTTWTDMRTYTTLPAGSASFLNAVDTPSSQARFIRFFFTTKQSGSNVAIDDISIAVPVAGAAQEIAASFNNKKVTTGSTIWFNAPLNTPTNFKVKIYNLGSDSTLTLSSAAITGTNASDFTLGAVPSSIAPKDSGEVNFTFNTANLGTRFGVLTFNNNDADENPFVINLNGVGGDYASEPTQNPNINFSNIKAYSIKVGVKNNASDGYLVLRKQGSAVTDAPVDGVTYAKGQGIGSSKVFYVGKDTSFTTLETFANTTYHFAVFPFNGVGQYINYKQSSPTTASQTSANGKPSASYYSGIDTANPNFVTSLSTLINNHKQIFYSNYKSTIIDNFYTRDTVTGNFTKVVNCEYSGQFVFFNPPFDFTALNMSREHAFASSWMPTFGQPSHQDRYAYSDLHNLRLANQNDVNSPRSNNPFADLANQTGSFLLAKFGTDSSGKKAFEPRDEIKGDVARSIMYMMIAYNRQPNKASGSADVVNPWSLDSLVIPGVFPNPDEVLSTRQKQAILKKWHFQDLPSNEEYARNQYVADQQNNRNPLIDYPEWACFIDFNTMRYIANGCNGTVGIKNIETLYNLSVLPNPASDYFSIFVDANQRFKATVELINAEGKVVKQQTEEIYPETNFIQLELQSIPSGIYIIKISGNGSIQKKVQILK